MTPSALLNPKFFILQSLDTIQLGDEYYNPITDAWMLVQSEFIGEIWNEDESKPVRRQNKEYKTPEQAYFYARDVVKGRCPELESTIAQNPYCAYIYAKEIIKGRFIEGENAITEDPNYIYWYALNVVHGRFIEGERAIAKNAYWAFKYACDVIDGRFIEAEESIAASQYAKDYIRLFKLRMKKVFVADTMCFSAD
jgi:hypothetical protein